MRSANQPMTWLFRDESRYVRATIASSRCAVGCSVRFLDSVSQPASPLFGQDEKPRRLAEFSRCYWSGPADAGRRFDNRSWLPISPAEREPAGGCVVHDRLPILAARTSSVAAASRPWSGLDTPRFCAGSP